MLHDKYSPNLAILAFPCNQFGGQEPGSDQDIKTFAHEKYNAKFDLFAKMDVNGERASPLYRYLKKAAPGTVFNGIKWNYTKFLITKTGRAFQRYSPQTEPLGMIEDIEMLLSM